MNLKVFQVQQSYARANMCFWTRIHEFAMSSQNCQTMLTLLGIANNDFMSADPLTH